jgi:hypothetical protein
MINSEGDFRKQIYIGGGRSGKRRKKNLEMVAEKHFKGNVSALFNDAVNRLYHLDPKTGEPLSPPKKP